MNKSDYMIKFDTTTFSILLAYFIKNTVKSMTYKCVVIEWEQLNEKTYKIRKLLWTEQKLKK